MNHEKKAHGIVDSSRFRRVALAGLIVLARILDRAVLAATEWEGWSAVKKIYDLIATVLSWCVAAGFLFGLCYIAFGVYGWVDSAGYISHREETVISARSDWLVGESKECTTSTLNSDSAALLNKSIGFAMASVACDGGIDHKMEVTFYGRKVQPEYNTVTWRCIRNETSFTCYQTGGQR